MRVMIITVAGMSTRFAASLKSKNIQDDYPVIKCLYNEENMRQSLLYRLLQKTSCIDKYIIVGGYGFDELERTLDCDEFDKYRNKILLVKNENYKEYGSGYSLYIGLKEALKLDFDEIIFAEGDLFFDELSFARIEAEKNNVLTICHEPILASKAVALYVNAQGNINYIYDTEHDCLQIKEPFVGIYNSGQVWKFYDSTYVRTCFDELDEKQWHGTNLAYIQKYFGSLSKDKYSIIDFKEWVNCNTIEDWKEAQKNEDITRKTS